MGYEELSLKGFIKEIEAVTNGPHPRRFCFVLGAGASRNSGILSGQELVDIWDNELYERNKKSHLEWKGKIGITEENKYCFYSKFYERRFSKLPMDGYNYLEKIMENVKPSIGYVMLSHIVSQTIHNVVITTNFDHLTEDTMNYYNQKLPLVIGHESLAHYISKDINRPTIVKIHRDLLFDPKNRTNELEELHADWKKALDLIFSNYHPVFIGYAGNDKSIMDYLSKNSLKFANGTWCTPYWMLYDGEMVDDKISEFLNEAEGFLVMHEGFDEVMCYIGNALNCKIISKEEFIMNAEKRFQLFENAMYDITEKNSLSEEIDENVTEINRSDHQFENVIKEITHHQTSQQAYRNVIILSNRGCYEEAIKKNEELIALEPENARYYYSLGITYHKMKNFENAVKEKEKAVQLEPDNAKYHNSLSVSLYRLDKYEEALEECNKAISLEPYNPNFYYHRAFMMFELQRYEAALDAIQEAIELDPQKAKYHEKKGRILYRMKKYEDALTAQQEALNLEPHNHLYHEGYNKILDVIQRKHSQEMNE